MGLGGEGLVDDVPEGVPGQARRLQRPFRAPGGEGGGGGRCR